MTALRSFALIVLLLGGAGCESGNSTTGGTTDGNPNASVLSQVYPDDAGCESQATSEVRRTAYLFDSQPQTALDLRLDGSQCFQFRDLRSDRLCLTFYNGDQTTPETFSLENRVALLQVRINGEQARDLQLKSEMAPQEFCWEFASAKDIRSVDIKLLAIDVAETSEDTSVAWLSQLDFHATTADPDRHAHLPDPFPPDSSPMTTEPHLSHLTLPTFSSDTTREPGIYMAWPEMKKLQPEKLLLSDPERFLELFSGTPLQRETVNAWALHLRQFPQYAEASRCVQRPPESDVLPGGADAGTQLKWQSDCPTWDDWDAAYARARTTIENATEPVTLTSPFRVTLDDGDHPIAIAGLERTWTDLGDAGILALEERTAFLYDTEGKCRYRIVTSRNKMVNANGPATGEDLLRFEGSIYQWEGNALAEIGHASLWLNYITESDCFVLVREYWTEEFR